MADGQLRPVLCPTSGPRRAPLPARPEAVAAARGDAGGGRDAGFGRAGPPFCPRHCLPGAAEVERSRRQEAVPPLQLPVPPQVAFRLVNRSAIGEASGARDAFGHGLEFWYCPSQLEESTTVWCWALLLMASLPQEAERNAQELVAEEERMKKKAEKKKLKKKKQKDRKKREKLGQELKSKQEAESDELDLSCTFVFKARQKAGVKLPAPGKEKPARMNDAELGKRAPEKAPEPEPVGLDTSVVEQSLILAGRGNEAAQKGHYAEAVQAFTEAMKLNPREHRLFGNRSYCYEKLQRYEEALRDAQVSLGLQPGWPKGFFRKGKALRGLKRYAEAASTFEELLRLDGANAEASAQLEACRALLRTSPHGQSSLGGLPVSPSLLEAGEPPLPASEEWAGGSCQDTDTSDFVTVVSSRSQARAQGRATGSSQQTLPPTHPARDCYPLWVGNITSRISKKVLHSSFSPFGEIRFIRMLPERRCAFINYTRKAAAEAAYVAMQDAEVEGSRLVLQLKHPSHATPSPRWHSEPRGKVGALPGGLL
ncbi:tetratricopeptide repeat protein 31 [Numenius arquata]|uniref:tetratricopeptide repeat protein 31 n=1 Tax=Numenius arquata TaxID=31919 RepID=UPI003D3080B0